MAANENPSTNSTSLLTSEALQTLNISLKGLRFGSIEIVVHDGQIVQIDRLEKFRLDKNSRRN